jgi:hypothetical protein
MVEMAKQSACHQEGSLVERSRLEADLATLQDNPSTRCHICKLCTFGCAPMLQCEGP